MNYIIRVLNGIRYRLNYLYFNGYLMPRRRAKIGLTGGKGVELGKNIQSLGSGKLVCGDKCRLHDNVSFCFNPINGNTPEIRIGKGASIGKYNDFGCSLLIEIEEMSLLLRLSISQTGIIVMRILIPLLCISQPQSKVLLRLAPGVGLVSECK